MAGTIQPVITKWTYNTHYSEIFLKAAETYDHFGKIKSVIYRWLHQFC